MNFGQDSRVGVVTDIITSENMNSMDAEKLKLGFIGAGNMGHALAFGMISNGVIIPEHTWASAPTMDNLKKFESLGCHITHSNDEVVQNCDVILLCVKPFKAADVLSNFRQKGLFRKEHLIISIISGIKIETLEFYLLPGMRIVRTMPNLPVHVQAGAFVYALGRHATEEDGFMVKYLFSKLGVCEEISENLIDAVCGLSGSGPAYVYTVIQAMSDGGVKMGLTRRLATKLAAQTVLGAAKMVLETGKHPDVLRDEVCSPGGTTICGVHALERAAVRSALVDAVEAATLRAREMDSNRK